MRELYAELLPVLKDAALDIPKARPPGPLDEFLKAVFQDYLARVTTIKGTLAKALDNNLPRIEALCNALIAAYQLGSKQDVSAAYEHLDAGVCGVRGELISMSRRHSSVLPNQSWYRLASWGATEHEHMFHLPFGCEQKSYRFSVAGIPGAPAIYLANSVYLCWLECGEPDYHKCMVSRFEVDMSGRDYLDLCVGNNGYLAPIGLDIPGVEIDPARVMNSPFATDVAAEVLEYLIVWPLLTAITVRKLEDVPEPPEYVIPQLLMRWVSQQTDFLGIRYFTSKHAPSTNSQDLPINVALPARSSRDSGYDEFLADLTRFTAPQPLSAMLEKPLKDLVTKESGDRRQEASGRYMIYWPDGRLEHYIGTVFGKMEYWLDRPEIELKRIQNA